MVSDVCGGDVSRRVRGKALIFASLCLGIVSAASAMEPLGVQTIIDDMTLPHEAKLSGVPTSYDWGSGPRIGWGNNPPDDWHAVTGWGQIYREDGSTIPANTRVQIRNFEVYLLKKSDWSWVKLLDSDDLGIGGGAYVENFNDDANKEPNVRDEGNQSVSVKLEYGYNYHFWPKTRASIDPNNVGALFCVYEARLILGDPNGTDDRGQARLLAGCGGDYWRDLSAQWKSDWSNNGDFAIGRMKFVTNDWHYFTVCTYDPIQNVGDNPPPPVGDAPQVDTSPPSAPANLSASAVGSSQIDLTWEGATDGESGVTGYKVYRDETEIATVDNTSYSDRGLVEGTGYTYRVSAVNGEGIEGAKSGEASATTGSDQEAPKIHSVAALSGTSVKVVFDEPVTRASAEQSGNYEINGGINVTAASLDSDNQSLTLTTSALALGSTYMLTVSDITDRSPNANTGGDQAEFSFSEELEVSSLTAASGRAYEFVESIAEGDHVYIDRDYTFTSLGDYAGMGCIRTANDDKNETAEHFLSFDVNRAVTVYVAWDTRVDTPSWLSSWDHTGDEVQVSTDNMDAMEVLSREFDAGTVTLGSNGASAEDKSMYSVFIDTRSGATGLDPRTRMRHDVAPVRAVATGTTLRIVGLRRNTEYTVTLTDACGRVSGLRRTTGTRGAVTLSTAQTAHVVYMVNIRSGQHQRTMTTVIP